MDIEKAAFSLRSSNTVERFGSYFDSMAALPAPSDFDLRLQSALQAGLIFGRDVWSFSLTRALQRAEDTFYWSWFPSDLEPSSAWLLVLRGAFWSEAANITAGLARREGLVLITDNVPIRKSFPAEFGARGQADLTRAFMRLSLDDRQRVYSTPRRTNPLRVQSWQRFCRGALCVCRVSRFLMENGLVPILPTVRVDIDYMTDLIVNLNEEQPHYRCLQIKSEPETCYIPLPIDGHTLEMQSRIRRLAWDFGLRCSGGIVHLASDTSFPWDTLPSDRMRAALKPLFIP